MEKTYSKPEIQILTISHQNVVTASSDEIIDEETDKLTVKLPFVSFR